MDLLIIIVCVILFVQPTVTNPIMVLFDMLTIMLSETNCANSYCELFEKYVKQLTCYVCYHIWIKVNYHNRICRHAPNSQYMYFTFIDILKIVMIDLFHLCSDVSFIMSYESSQMQANNSIFKSPSL